MPPAKPKRAQFNMKPGISRIFKSVNEKSRLSKTAKTYLNEMLYAVLLEIVETTTTLRKHSNLETVQVKHVQAAVQLKFPWKGEMVAHAISEGNGSTTRYKEAKKNQA